MPGPPYRPGPTLQIELLKLFPTPVLYTTIPDAEALNAELKRIILAPDGDRVLGIERKHHK